MERLIVDGEAPPALEPVLHLVVREEPRGALEGTEQSLARFSWQHRLPIGVSLEGPQGTEAASLVGG
jgi:hypothetical protein